MTSCAWPTGCSTTPAASTIRTSSAPSCCSRSRTRPGTMQERTIIDGQQRLTTLQLLLDALHAELLAVEAISASDADRDRSSRTPSLLREARGSVQGVADEPRPAGVQRGDGAEPPVDYDAARIIAANGMVEAHRFFSEQAREWLSSTAPSDSRSSAPQRSRRWCVNCCRSS